MSESVTEMLNLMEASPSSPAMAESSRLAAYFELTKPRIAAMVLVAATVGFYFARSPDWGLAAWLSLGSTLAGIGLVAAGANALNQYLEAEFDARMARTRNRPLPSGRLSPTEVLTFGVALSGLGVLYLAVQVNALSALLAALTLASYAFVYTPMKRFTPLCVYAGAVSGALPPVIGWAAGAGTLSPQAWLLFAILYFWQLPHVAAIAWQYRHEYVAAGYLMTPPVEDDGFRTCRHMITHSVSLIMASLLPVFAAMTGPAYAVSAMILGGAFLVCGAAFVRRRSAVQARGVVIASVVYLPVLLLIMMLDRAA